MLDSSSILRSRTRLRSGTLVPSLLRFSLCSEICLVWFVQTILWSSFPQMCCLIALLIQRNLQGCISVKLSYICLLWCFTDLPGSVCILRKTIRFFVRCIYYNTSFQHLCQQLFCLPLCFPLQTVLLTTDFLTAEIIIASPPAKCKDFFLFFFLFLWSFYRFFPLSHIKIRLRVTRGRIFCFC